MKNYFIKSNKFLLLGELMARGHNVMLGYWRDEEKTKEAINNCNWFITG